MRVGVAGLGLIGGSLLRGLTGSAGFDEDPTGRAAASAAGFDADPAGTAVAAAGFDANPAARAAAAAEGFEVVDALDGLAGCELIVVAVPPWATAAVVTAALAAAPEAMVADTASVKAPVVEAVAERERFVAAHPLAGAETAGWAASSAGLLRGATWAVCPAGDGLEPVCRLAAAVERLDGRLVPCTAADHDEAVARTSHVPHVAAQALARLLAGDPLRAALTGGGYRDMTRVARSDAALWAEILLANRPAVLAGLDALEAELGVYRGALEARDRERLARAWDAVAGALEAREEAGWEPTRDRPGNWDALLALGRAGRAVRRLRLDEGDLVYEVSR